MFPLARLRNTNAAATLIKVLEPSANLWDDGWKPAPLDASLRQHREILLAELLDRLALRPQLRLRQPPMSARPASGPMP